MGSIIERAVAQDYWLQKMTVAERFVVMEKNPRMDGEAPMAWYRRCLDYVYKTHKKAVTDHQIGMIKLRDTDQST